MTDKRLNILTAARQSLQSLEISSAERDYLVRMLDILTNALQKDEMNEGDDLTLAESLISNQALLAQLKQQVDELDTLKKLSINLTSSLDLPTVLDAVVAEAMRLVKNTRDVHIFLYKNRKLEFGAALDSDGNKNKMWATPRPNGLTLTVARQGKTIIVENMQDHPLFATAPKDWDGSIIGMPLKMGDTVLGVMNLSRSTIGGFTSSETRLLGLLSDQAAVAISNASLHQTISKQAYSDTVTGLPNRRALDERLEEEVSSARRGNYSFAVVMMDLDGFKDINDTYGHSTGDEVLRVVFNYFSRGVRNTDFLARYGGDELTLILSQSDLSAAQIVAEKILETLPKIKFTLPDGKKLKVSVSGGIALYPLHARSGPDLLRAADAALYQAKKYQRGTFMIARGITGPLASHQLGTL